MFAMCEGMKWNHLPLGGGLYDQDPELLDGFRIIFAERADHESQEEKRREAESRRGGSGRGVAGRRRR